jgi:hypothetical protein
MHECDTPEDYIKYHHKYWENHLTQKGSTLDRWKFCGVWTCMYAVIT